jgi:hypothetical protein
VHRSSNIPVTEEEWDLLMAAADEFIENKTREIEKQFQESWK